MRQMRALVHRGAGHVSSRLLVCGMALLPLLGAACGPASGADQSRQAIISGADGREDVYALEPSVAQALVAPVAALMFAQHVVFTGSERLAVRALSLGDTLGLCPDEPFRDQPDAALCSGVLVDDDLLVTAGHCLGADAESAAALCRELRVVFGFELAQPSWDGSVNASDVFSCKRVVLQERVVGDYAVLQLDRSAATVTRKPAPLGAPPAVFDLVSVSSTGAGLPLKVELGASVLEASDTSPFFVAATDTFGGGSGGGVFAQDFGLVGLVDRGGVDWENVGNCTRSAQVDQSAEQHQYAEPIRAALCAQPWPSAALCGMADVCGDHVCGSTESNDACPEDCALPQCGDGLCELSERASCPADCHRFDSVPVSWVLDPEEYLLTMPAASSGSESPSGCAISAAPGRRPAAYLPLLLLAAGCLWSRLRQRRRRTTASTVNCCAASRAWRAEPADLRLAWPRVALRQVTRSRAR